VRTGPGDAADQIIKAAPVQDLDEEELKSKTHKIMSLPCTVVASASGTRELLDLTYAPPLIIFLPWHEQCYKWDGPQDEEFCCSRLHYVTHRLALGEDGLRDLIAAESKIFGHSVFENTSSLAVLSVPVMEWEEGAQTNSSANCMLQNDPVVRKHLQVGASQVHHHPIVVCGTTW
jgi:hypothetical protein